MSGQYGTTRPEDGARMPHHQLFTCPRCGQQFQPTAALVQVFASHALGGCEPAPREQDGWDQGTGCAGDERAGDGAAAEDSDYVASGGLADRYAAAVRSLDEQAEILAREKRYLEQVWALREQQIEDARANLAAMVADLIRIGAWKPAIAPAEFTEEANP